MAFSTPLILSFFIFEACLSCAFGKSLFGLFGAPGSQIRVIGGVDAPADMIPFQTFLTIQVGHMRYACGGSLISPEFVLTAAHCVEGASFAKVTLGITDLRQHGRVYFVDDENIFGHPNYTSTTFHDDLALLRLPEPVLLSDAINIISLPDPSFLGDNLEGKEVRVSGWGKTRDREWSVHNELQYANLTIASQTSCQKFYMENFGVDIWEGQICTDFDGSGTCSGDSGGPLVLGGTASQVGIVSLGVVPCESGGPNVYTAIAYYLEWIDSIIKAPSTNNQ